MFVSVYRILYARLLAHISEHARVLCMFWYRSAIEKEPLMLSHPSQHKYKYKYRYKICVYHY